MPTFELQIWLPGRGAWRQLVRAESLDRALQIAKHKWPKSLVQIPVPAAKKPKLVRSRTCPRAAARTRAKLMKDKQMQPPAWAQEAWARVKVDQARADFLEKLYFEDGRDKKDHPFYHTYTGLFQAYQKKQAG